MRVLPVIVAMFLAGSGPVAGAQAIRLQAPPGDTVLGIVTATVASFRDTIGLQLPVVATAPQGAEIRLVAAADGWFQGEYQGQIVWTPQKAVRVTTSSVWRKEQLASQASSRSFGTIIGGVAAGVVALLLGVGIVVRRRRFQEIRRRWILLASRHEALADALTKAGWDVQKLPEGTRMREFLPHARPTIVIADQAVHSADISALEARSASVASTPVLWLDSTVVARQDPSRAFLPPGSKVSAILKTLERLAKVVPGPEQLSRHAEIEGRLGQGRLLELLHFLASARRTGRVEVKVGPEPSWLWLEDGQLRHAIAGSLVGIPALFHCLGLTQGSFSFRAGVTPPERRVKENTLTLLHEFARQHDENAKVPRA
jgi:hypothetical protein